MSQWKYVMDLLEESGMLGCKPIDPSVDPNSKIRKETYILIQVITEEWLGN